ncbi:hypothetical protein [Serratia fonticola]|jgi:hypothetical protein|uniref:hypothetical protein n=1 Tax=Serratia fonticola TaxID=47917 RepID=UPI00217C222E|nr:hypothetical protein [Serratia fonticola]CAI1011029.1 Uncharacterised protein [Serratia fonticola]CAI1012004.1 Uncharacterised protein [Serratia fonticola]CAI1613915.1 Uncharacterised protein [Serratia fonticola]CAI1739158.1 Uncharacterised protein [Serratia fonticola]CAI1787140.1 Uncharacterised protein [Serratia fonticola]
MNKILPIGVFAVLSWLFFWQAKGVYQLYTQHQHTHFNCDAILQVYKDDVVLSLAFNYQFQGDSGIAILKGTLKQGAKITNVSRKNHFTFDYENGFYHLKSTSVIVSPADNSDTEEVAHYLPRFYLQPGMIFDFSVYPIGSKGVVFSTGYVPSFYCARS